MLHNDFKQYMFDFRNQTVVKLLETLQCQFLLPNICKKDIYIQVGQIVKNGLNTLKSKMFNEFLFSFNSIEHK